jgi:exodeoxyribonuclease VII large subunit
LRAFVFQSEKGLERSLGYSIEIQRQRARTVFGKLESLSPLSILRRGYSITRKLPNLEILRDAAGVREGERVEVTLHRGTLHCAVEKTENF